MEWHGGAVAVIGAGVIGVGVAESLATSGHRVILVDVSEDRLASAKQRLRDSLRAARLLGPPNDRNPPARVLESIAFTTGYDGFDGVTFVVENVTERWAVKKPVYERLDAVCSSECIFAANTSAIPIAHIAATTRRPDRVIGIHFMNPVPRKAAVEVIRSRETSDSTLVRTHALLATLGKHGIVVQDGPGFVSNRVLMLTINEAVLTLQDGIAGAADVDRVFKECFGHPMGPLETADLIGLDTVLDTLEVLREFTGESKFAPASLLREMVDAGNCGRKSGSGFHRYG